VGGGEGCAEEVRAEGARAQGRHLSRRGTGKDGQARKAGRGRGGQGSPCPTHLTMNSRARLFREQPPKISTRDKATENKLVAGLAGGGGGEEDTGPPPAVAREETVGRSVGADILSKKTAINSTTLVPVIVRPTPVCVPQSDL
jgi:hypothetical protein